VRKPLDKFTFSFGLSDITWRIEHLAIEFTLTLSLAVDDSLEFWQLSMKNLTDECKNISVYPCFSIGYMSWMNQSASYCADTNAIIAKSITPYQQLDDYYKNQHLKDCTFLLAEREPTSWTANQQGFEGEGFLQHPDGIKAAVLPQQLARYETPIAVMQYDIVLSALAERDYKFIFGPCKNQQEVRDVRMKYFSQESVRIRVSGQSSRPKSYFDYTKDCYNDYIAQSQNKFRISSDDKNLDQFINHWLPRQVFYHGDSNRLTTDPQTRNYLQDAMGMCFISPEKTRTALLITLAQQSISGCLPDGILLHPDAEIKYINLVPHSDHCIWLPICLQVYLDETNDVSILAEEIAFNDDEKKCSVKTHVEMALDYLLNATDERGLNYIEQGDWCDPLNMVGHKGKGVSTWLSLATAYAAKQWCQLKKTYLVADDDKCAEYIFAAQAINAAVNQHLWDGHWYARGITDDNNCFGVAGDIEGRIFLNPQSWSILSGAANEEKVDDMINAIEQQLATPFGTMMLAPSYTEMRSDIGRLTQKSAGVSENGSVYNHASAFYAYSLFQIGKADKAFEQIKAMIPNQDNAKLRRQLPAFIPNYYRGAFYQSPELAGRSSQLFNTGTVAWVYRCIIEELCGLKGSGGKLIITPKLPSHWHNLTVERQFLSANFTVKIHRDSRVNQQKTLVDNMTLTDHTLSNIQAGQHYQVEVVLPVAEYEVAR
jgi:cellobionic acid phosphorylase